MTGKGNKVQKEMWNWEWKKAKPVGKDEKEATPATNEPEVPEAGEESKYQYPLICVCLMTTITFMLDSIRKSKSS